jgi:hypothetical protein
MKKLERILPTQADLGHFGHVPERCAVCKAKPTCFVVLSEPHYACARFFCRTHYDAFLRKASKRTGAEHAGGSGER